MIDSPENELLVLAQAGDKQAENELVGRFEKLNRKYGGRYSTCDADYDDVCQAAREGSLTAIRRFDSERGASLATVVNRYSSGYALNERTRVGAVMHRGPVVGERPDNEAPLGTIHVTPASSEPSPERALETADLRSQVAALIAACEEMDDTDRLVYEHRILASGKDRESLKVLADIVGCSDEWLRLKEVRLRRDVLPRLLKPLRAAL